MNEYYMNILLSGIGLILSLIVARSEYAYKYFPFSEPFYIKLMSFQCIIMCATEIAYSTIRYYGSFGHEAALTFIYGIAVVDLAILAFVWLMYCIRRANLLIPDMRKLHYFLMIPADIVVIGQIISYFNGMYFSIDRMGRFHSSPLGVLPWIIDPIYILSGAFILMTRKKSSFYNIPVITIVSLITVGSILHIITGMCTIGVMICVASVELIISLKKVQAYTDQLTGIYNRNYMDDVLQGMMLQAVERHQNVIGAVVDVNKFKSINDDYGHATGDDVLRLMGRILQCYSHRCIPIRTGGDEFLLIFFNKNMTEARGIYKEIQNRIINDNNCADLNLEITVSAGFDIYDGGSFKEFMDRLDVKMYEDKNGQKLQNA